jgi:hypothetical protein
MPSTRPPSLFDPIDQPAPVDVCRDNPMGDAHDWQDEEYIWPGETLPRLVEVCTRCGDRRGLA